MAVAPVATGGFPFGSGWSSGCCSAVAAVVAPGSAAVSCAICGVWARATAGVRVDRFADEYLFDCLIG